MNIIYGDALMRKRAMLDMSSIALSFSYNAGESRRTYVGIVWDIEEFEECV